MLSGPFIATAFYVRRSRYECRYECDQVEKTTTYSQDKFLQPVFRNELKPLFTRLSGTKLLQGCLKGLTQNANEAISSLLWSRCPKRVFCSKTKLEAYAAVSITEWNTGAAGTNNVK